MDFGRDVRPILSENCFQCHGQDAEAREARLRLDTREGQRKEGIIVPGKPDDSELIHRIFATDVEERMPPLESHRVLTDAQKQTLRRWVQEGAPYSEHWAFTPVKNSAPPVVKQSKWPRNAIDRFVLARLESEKLAPSPEAERERWLRRVTFDLT